MDPDSFKNDDQEKDEPECKVCFATQNLMGVPICECRGTVGNLCRGCLRTILTDENGDERIPPPVCADCKGQYRNYRVVERQPEMTYMEYVEQNSGFTWATFFSFISWEAIFLIGINVWYWVYPFETQLFQNSFYRFLCSFYAGLRYSDHSIRLSFI